MTTQIAGAAHDRGSDAAEQLRGFGPFGLLAILVIVLGSFAGPLVSAVLIVGWARLSDTPLEKLGFSRPQSWTRTIVVGVAFGIVLKLVLKAVVMPLLGAPAVNASYHYLAGNLSAVPDIVLTVLVSAGIGEEVFFRGYLFERLEARLGRSTAAVAAAVVISTLLFAAAHYRDQGLPGVEQAAIIGLIFGGIFAVRRQIWLLMIAHAAFDLTAIALIFADLESSVAHFVFR